MRPSAVNGRLEAKAEFHRRSQPDLQGTGSHIGSDTQPKSSQRQSKTPLEHLVQYIASDDEIRLCQGDSGMSNVNCILILPQTKKNRRYVKRREIYD